MIVRSRVVKMELQVEHSIQKPGGSNDGPVRRRYIQHAGLEDQRRAVLGQRKLPALHKMAAENILSDSGRFIGKGIPVQRELRFGLFLLQQQRGYLLEGDWKVSFTLTEEP